MNVQKAERAAWIAVDWGTTHVRAWAMGADGSVLAEARSDKGMGCLTRAEYEPVLLSMVSQWLGAGPTQVLICGMAGSRQGWAEAAYLNVPCKPQDGAPVIAPCADPRLDVRILPGLSQASPPDVMRGEETQIAGFQSRNPDFDGVICLPGTHSKWVHVSAGEVVSFRTFLTGEMFAALSKHTVLRHSLTDGWDDAAFARGVEDALTKPEMLAARLFTLRADGLLNGTDGATTRAHLSGLLIGAEIAAAKPYWLGQNVAIIGASELCALYAQALEAQGLPVLRAKGSDATLAGLRAAHALQSEHTQ